MQPPERSNVNLGTSGRPLILIGATVRAAAQSARRAGFRVTGIDLFGDTDTRAACENYVELGESSLSRLANLHPDRATTLLVTGGLEGHVKLMADLHRRYKTLGLGLTSLEKIRSPAHLQQLAQAAGIRFPEFHPSGRGVLVDSATESQSYPAAPGAMPGWSGGAGFRWLVKDPRGCGGLSVRWAQSTPAFDSPHCYAQRWVPGRLFGASFLGDGSSASLLGVCRGRFTRIGNRPFVYAGSLGPVVLPAEHRESISRIGQILVQEFCLRGLFNVDLTIDGNDIFLLEVNPRWSASCELIERAMIDAGRLMPTQSLLGLAIEGCRGDGSCTALADFPTRYLKRVVFSRRTGQFDVTRIDGVSEWGAELADVPRQKSLIRGGEPILSVILKYPPGGFVRWHDLRRMFAVVQDAVR